MNAVHDDDCFLSGGDDGRFPCICRPRVKVGNAALRNRLLRKAALLTQRHSEMAAIDAPPLDRLGWMRPYRIASNAVYARLHAIEMPL